MSISDACFGGGTKTSEYIDCTFNGSKITAGSPGCARFVHCSFRDVLIREFFCQNVEFIDCVFSGKLLKGYFNGVVPEDSIQRIGRRRNEFRGNDFSQMELIDVAFRTGIDLASQRLPVGPDYLYVPDAARVVSDVRKQVIAWKDLKLRREAMIVIQVLELQLEGNQKQLFLHVRDLMPRESREAAEKVYSLLRARCRVGTAENYSQ